MIVNNQLSDLIIEKKLSSNCVANLLYNDYIKNNNNNKNNKSSIVQFPIESNSKSFSLLLNNNYNNDDSNNNNSVVNSEKDIVSTIKKNGPKQNQTILLRGLNKDNLKFKLNLFNQVNSLSSDLILKFEISNQIIDACFSNKEIKNYLINIYYDSEFNCIKFINFDIIIKDRASDSNEINLVEFTDQMKSIIALSDYNGLEINNKLIRLFKSLQFNESSLNSNDSIINEITSVWSGSNINFESLKNYIYYNDISPTEKILKMDLCSSKRDCIIKLLRSQSIDILLKSINSQFSNISNGSKPDSYELNHYSKLTIIEVPSFISRNSLSCNSLLSNYFNDIIQDFFYREMEPSFNLYSRYPNNGLMVKALGQTNGLLSVFDSKNIMSIKDKIVFSDVIQMPESSGDLFIFNHDAGCIKSSYSENIYKENLMYEPSKVFSNSLSSYFKNYQSDIQLFKNKLSNLNLESSTKLYSFNITPSLNNITSKESVEESLKLCGVYSILELPITPFINRLEFTYFNEVFQDLLKDKFNFIQDTKSILESSNIDPSNYSIGQFKLFINEKAISELKKLKSQVIHNSSSSDIKYNTPLKTKLNDNGSSVNSTPISQRNSRSFNGNNSYTHDTPFKRYTQDTNSDIKSNYSSTNIKSNKDIYDSHQEKPINSPLKKNLFNEYNEHEGRDEVVVNPYSENQDSSNINIDISGVSNQLKNRSTSNVDQKNYIINNTYNNYYNTVIGDENETQEKEEGQSASTAVSTEPSTATTTSKLNNIDINNNEIIFGEYNHIRTLCSDSKIIKENDNPSINVNRYLIYLEQYLKLRLTILGEFGEVCDDEVKHFINSLYLLLKKSKDQDLFSNLFKTSINEYILTFLNKCIKRKDPDDDNNYKYSFGDVKMIAIISNYLTVVPYNEESFERYYSDLNGVMVHLFLFKSIVLNKDISLELLLPTENFLRSLYYITSRPSVVKSMASKVGWFIKEGVHIVPLLSNLFSNLNSNLKSNGENFMILIIKIVKNLCQCKEFNSEFIKTGLINSIVKQMSKGYIGIIGEFKELFIEVVRVNSIDKVQMPDELYTTIIKQFPIIGVSLLKYILNIESSLNSFKIIIDCFDTLLRNEFIFNFINALLLDQNHSFFSCLQLIKFKSDNQVNIEPLSPSTDFNNYWDWRNKLTIDQVKILNERCNKKLSLYSVEWEPLKIKY